MIRLILVLFAVVAFLILSIPILIVEWLIGKKNPKLRDESSLHIVQFIKSTHVILSHFFSVSAFSAGCQHKKG